MSGSFSVNSPPTSENNGKNSSDCTSTSNGGVRLCPFQLAPPINQYTYCVLKRICRRILKEILSEEQKEISTVKDDLIKNRNKEIINDTTICPNCQQISLSLESPLALKNHHKNSSTSMQIIQKSNKITQTENIFLNGAKNYNSFMKNHNFKKQVKKDFLKKNITLRPQLHKSGLPLILNLRLKVRNADIIGSDS